jgi:hypothetical protein
MIADEYNIGQEATEMIYMSPYPYCDSFDELLNICCFVFSQHYNAGLLFIQYDIRVILAHMVQGTPGAKTKIPCWQTHICGAWLIKIGNHLIHSIIDACKAFSTLQDTGCTHAPLLVAHPEICPDILWRGLPIVSSTPFFTQQIHDQLNDRWEFSTVANHLRRDPSYKIVNDGGVLNVILWVMKLTHGKLIKQPS